MKVVCSDADACQTSSVGTDYRLWLVLLVECVLFAMTEWLPDGFPLPGVSYCPSDSFPITFVSAFNSLLFHLVNLSTAKRQRENSSVRIQVSTRTPKTRTPSASTKREYRTVPSVAGFPLLTIIAQQRWCKPFHHVVEIFFLSLRWGVCSRGRAALSSKAYHERFHLQR